MKEVKLGPAIVTSFRNTTVAIAVATMLSASMAASGAGGAEISSALAGTTADRQHDRAAREHHARGRDQRVGRRPVARDNGVDGVADGAAENRQLIEQFRPLPSQLQERLGADQHHETAEADDEARQPWSGSAARRARRSARAPSW